MNKIKRSVPEAFDPAGFRAQGHKIIDTLADYLDETLNGGDMPVLPWKDPDSLADYFAFSDKTGENEPVEDFVKKILDASIHIHHPHYIGHQVTSPLPITALVQLCTTILNNGAAIYEMGPVNMAMERNVVKKFASLMGYPATSDGIFTHGGSAGNLTGMLAARQARTDYNIWEEGIQTDCRPAYMISEQAHYSVGRNVKIMGLGDESIIRVPVDENYRMKTSELESLRLEAENKGLKVICVVASACSTATGTYDDLDAIAGFCEKYGLWMHVDGAHGLGILFSDKHRHLAKGIGRADSVVIDFHKMFLVPALNSLVMFKNAGSSYETFAQKASYLFQSRQNNQWYNSAIRTLECTKSALGIVAYTAIKYYGDSYYGKYIDSRYELTKHFASLLKDAPDFSIATEPQTNIICFRYSPAGYDDVILNNVNAAMRDEIIKDGTFYIVQAELGGKIWMRSTVINPVTDENDLKELISVARQKGQKLLAIHS